ncbi:FG-GAP-like repeat-containing protein [Streptomyces sp. NPDC047315]|uniref:FG-GAP-like repeat-containing protein n=1 Tax=Streptomyces sp. NPDC047315 TaxID=3155142 RepID=UPI0033FC7598
MVYALVTALVAGLLSAGAVLAGAGAAVAAPGGPPAAFYIQNVKNGFALSAARDNVDSRPPKGNEDHQQWEFVPQSDGSHWIRSTSRDGQCLGRSNANAWPSLVGCGNASGNWWLQGIAGEKYSLHTGPGSAERLAAGQVTDEEVAWPIFSTATDETAQWYVTPIDPPKTPRTGDDLTDPTFDQLTFLTTHNAFQNTEDIPGVMGPAQPHSIVGQLNDGVRGLMIDVHNHHGTIGVCHKPCSSLEIRPLENVLADITQWLNRPDKRNEIVTLFIEDRVSAAQLKSAFDHPSVQGALSSLIYNPRLEQVHENGWPRRSEMINDNKRLIVFSDKHDDENAAREGFGVMSGKDWTVENYWSMGPGLGNSNWRCFSRWHDVPLTKEEPKFRRLFVMNHFRDAPLAPTYTNDNSKLQNRAERFCMPAARKKPNFLAVDQYKNGDPTPLTTVAKLNEYTYHGDTPGQGGTQPPWQIPRLAVMPIGDSITQGVGSSTGNGYRDYLRNHLQGRVGTLDFVGSLQHGNMPDPDHEGHSGFLIEQVAADIESWLYAAKPNVITLHLGSNDINRNHEVATAPARLGNLMDRILAVAPDVTILVAGIVPNYRQAVGDRVNAFNNALPGVVAARQANGFKVFQVNFPRLKVNDLPDGLHPNDNGYRKMARGFYDVLARPEVRGVITENVTVAPAPPGAGLTLGDQDVDFDADGRADYLVVGTNGSVRALLNRGGDNRGGWEDLGQVASGSSQWTGDQVRFADFDADGRTDYLVVGTNGSVRALLNRGGDGRGGWEDLGQVASGSSQWTGDQVRFADVNADGRTDYLVVGANGNARALLNRGGDNRGGWENLGHIAAGSSQWTGGQVRFADINADNIADYLVVGANGSVRALLNRGGDGRGGWEDLGQIASGSSHWTGGQVRFGDINADNVADYLVIGANGSVRALLNLGGDGRGGWQSLGYIGLGSPQWTGRQVRI